MSADEKSAPPVATSQLSLVPPGAASPFMYYEAALSSGAGHSFPLSAHKSRGAVEIEQSEGRLRG